MSDGGPTGEPAVEAPDPVLDALRQLARTIEQNSARNRQILSRIESLKALRTEGRGYAEIVPRAERPLIVELASHNIEALIEAGSRLRKAEARALHDEGLTMDRIAELFGVTRQRISQLLREAPSSTGAS